MADSIDETALRAAVARIAARMPAWVDELNRLDAAAGDGDLGVTMGKGAAALQAHLATLDGAALDRMLRAADAGVQERGKASLGDKTVVDALHPAAEAFAAAIEQ